MKKILSLILTVFMMFSMSLCISCKSSEPQTSQSQEYGELKLKRSVYYIPIQYNGDTCKYRVDFATEAERESTEVFAISQDESIVTIKDGRICSGSKFGKTKVEIYTDKKKAFLDVEVVRTVRFLQESIADASYLESTYLACLWFQHNLNSFKKPESVEVLDVCYHEENGKIDYFVLQVRAENGFGGNTIGYYNLTYSAIASGYSPYLFSSDILMNGFHSNYGCSYLNSVVTEYKLGLISL